MVKTWGKNIPRFLYVCMYTYIYIYIYIYIYTFTYIYIHTYIYIIIYKYTYIVMTDILTPVASYCWINDPFFYEKQIHYFFDHADHIHIYVEMWIHIICDLAVNCSHIFQHGVFSYKIHQHSFKIPMKS